jgi:hypothetical protein
LVSGTGYVEGDQLLLHLSAFIFPYYTDHLILTNEEQRCLGEGHVIWHEYKITKIKTLSNTA